MRVALICTPVLVLQREVMENRSRIFLFLRRLGCLLSACTIAAATAMAMDFVCASWYDGNDDGGRDFKAMRRERVGMGIAGKMFESPWRRR